MAAHTAWYAGMRRGGAAGQACPSLHASACSPRRPRLLSPAAAELLAPDPLHPTSLPQVVGGYDAVFKAIAATLGDAVQLNTPVAEVRRVWECGPHCGGWLTAWDPSGGRTPLLRQPWPLGTLCPPCLTPPPKHPPSPPPQIRDVRGGVEVVTEAGRVHRCDAVVVSVPLGVLKAGGLRFEPELPAWKLEAVRRLGFGDLNKVRKSRESLH